MLNKIPPLPNGLLPKLVYYPSSYYDDTPRSSSSTTTNTQWVVIMAETVEVVMFAHWDGVSPRINRFETHLKLKLEPNED